MLGSIPMADQAFDLGIPGEGLRPFRFAALLRGAKIYEFSDFYRAKNVLLRYDGRRDYLNYGYWPEGDATANPSAALVLAVARAGEIGGGDVVLNIGSGLGQPDVDIARRFEVSRIVGLNIHGGQVAHANQRARAAGFEAVIEHRVGDATALADTLHGCAPTRIIAVESLAEMRDFRVVLREAFRVLAPGGTLALCDVMTQPGASSGMAIRGLRLALTKTTAALYGDHWRGVDAYVEAIRDAGFDDVVIRSIGSAVYPFTYRYAKGQFGKLKELRCSRAASVLAYVNLRSMDALHALGSIDYVIVSARKGV